MKVWWRSELSQQSSVWGVQFCCQKCHSQHCPGGRQGGRASGGFVLRWEGRSVVPPPDTAAHQSGSSAEQRCLKIQWVWAMAKPVQNHHTENERRPDWTVPRQPLQAQNPVAQPLDKVIALPSGWTAAKGCSLSCTGALCSSEHLHPSSPDSCQLPFLPFGKNWKSDLLCSFNV